MFNTVIESEGNGMGRSYMILPNSLLMDRPIMVQSRDAPKIWDYSIRDSVNELDNKFDGHGEAAQESSSESSSGNGREVPVHAE